MSSLRTLIVDDEPLARQGLRALLAAEPNIEIIGECADGESAVRAIAELHPELVFLDVQMPELDGFGVIRRVGPEKMPAVVFVTAFDRYALRAFEVHALDYLLKPFDDERFRLALGRARAQVEQGRMQELSRRLIDMVRSSGLSEGGANGKSGEKAKRRDIAERLAIKSAGRVVFLKTEEVDWVEADDDRVKLHVGPKWYLVRERLQNLEGRLDPRRFVRIHRSTIVNLSRIQELRPCFHGDYVVLLRDGTELRLSRSHRSRLEARIGRDL